MISRRDDDYFKTHVRLKAVITTESAEISDRDFFNIPIINALIERKRFTMVNKVPHYDLSKDDDYFARIHRLAEHLLQKEGVSTIKELLEGLTYKNKNLYFATLNNFFDVQVYNHLTYDVDEPIPFSKDCLIGIEGSVNTDGTISICYSADTFVIGNVHENALYFDKIADYQNKRYNLTHCSRCFARRFCNFCFEKINDREGNLETQIRNFCRFTREFYRIIFKYMLTIVKRNPKLWNELQTIAEEAIARRGSESKQEAV